MTDKDMNLMGDEGFQLSDGLLEKIVGGVMSEKDVADYQEIMAHYKNAGMTKERFLAGYDFLGAEQQLQIAKLVDLYWNVL